MLEGRFKRERHKRGCGGKQTGWEGCDEKVTQQGGDGLSHVDDARRLEHTMQKEQPAQTLQGGDDFSILKRACRALWIKCQKDK